ncbi:hypothetical protein [Nocardiopsis sp. NPDC006938]|uniref:hypothetical protein n=1 Tax=Nocardiopsis sp. NPDC006938 TaxID=3364337 RepID=UPI00368AE04C
MAPSTQATFDPALRPGTVRRLSASPEALARPNGFRLPLPRWVLITLAVTAAAVAGAPLALFPEGPGEAVLVPLALVAASYPTYPWVRFVWTELLRGADSVGERALIWFLLLTTATAFSLVSVSLVGGAVWLALRLAPSTAALVAPGTPGAVLLWFLPVAVLVAILLLRRPWDSADLAAWHRDRYVVPADLGFTQSHRALNKLQRTTARAEHAHRVLGTHVGLDHALPLLRAEEWRLARECLHLDRLRDRLAGHEIGGVSAQVKEALAPQWKVLEKASRDLDTEVGRLDAFGRKIQAAVDTHEEWVRLQRVADQAGDFADLAARAPSPDAGTSDALTHSLHGAEAARAVREEMIRETAEATARLIREQVGTAG